MVTEIQVRHMEIRLELEQVESRLVDITSALESMQVQGAQGSDLSRLVIGLKETMISVRAVRRAIP